VRLQSTLGQALDPTF